MPKRRELEPWEQNLVSAIKEQHRFGYSVRPMRGKVQVQRFWSDTGKRETVTLPVAWEKGCQRDVLNGINAINDGLQKGLSLKTAAALAFDATTPGPKAKNNWLRYELKFLVTEKSWINRCQSRRLSPYLVSRQQTLIACHCPGSTGRATWWLADKVPMA